MPRFTFAQTAPGQWRVTRAEAVPTWVDLAPAIRLVDLPRALADPNTSAAQRATYQGAYTRIRAHLLGRAADRAGLVVARP